MYRKSKIVFYSALTITFLLLLTFSVWSETTVTIGTDTSTYVFSGKLVTPDKVIDGKLIIRNDTITCVGTDCVDPPGATKLSVTDSYIFPGFIDAHNHVPYNVLPKWKPPKLYSNRYEWRKDQDYLKFKEPYDKLLEKNLQCEMIKYSEIKAMISGVTTIQGTYPVNGHKLCYDTLIRNAENYNGLELPGNYITHILDIDKFNGKIDWNETKSLPIHLAEGVDEKSRQEFITMQEKGLFRGETAIIHGTALGEKEFKEMGEKGTKLIWSPQSNLVLYGQTTNVKLALENGVQVSLGVDWNLSGSNHILDELRVAEKVNSEKFGGIIKDWVNLITINPAKALALDGYIGRLAPDLKADISVLRMKDSNPSASLLKSDLQDVEMVWVGGNLLFADEPILQIIKPGQCELMTVYDSQKRVCVKNMKNPSDKRDQTLKDIIEVLKKVEFELAPLVP